MAGRRVSAPREGTGRAASPAVAGPAVLSSADSAAPLRSADSAASLRSADSAALLRSGDGAAVLRAAREGVLEALLRWSSSIIAPVLLVLTVQTYRADLPREPLYGLYVLLPPLLLLRLFSRRLSYRAKGVLLLSHMLLIALYGEIMHGFTPSAALANAALLLLAGLLFGAKAVGLSLVICMLSVAFSGLLFDSGIRFAGTDPLFDAREPLVWVRYALVLAGLGGGLAAAYVQLLNALQKAIAAMSAGFEREAEEREKRLAAQQALARHERLDSLAHVASGMAHDFNNSLMVMLGGAELIALHPAADAEIRRLAQDIAEEARASASSVQRALTLSRPSLPQRDELPASQLIAWLERSLRSLLPEGLTLRLRARGDARVKVDKSRIQQALLNLAINARDAMPTGGVLTLSCELRELLEAPAGENARPGMFVVIGLEDTGQGMESATLERIFEPFFTTKQQGKGTGLGLPTARAAVKEEGGFLQVASQPGAGTRFEVYLPCDAQSASASHPTETLRDAHERGHG